MSIRGALGIVAVFVVLQLFIGLLLYALSGPTPALQLSLIATIIGISAGVAGSIAAVLALIFMRYAKDRAIRATAMTLTEDERKVFEAILHSGGGARQDELRRELDMSKSKLSAIVGNLEGKHVITKTRYFKTNILKLSEEFESS